MGRTATIPDAALLVAGLTGIWFLLGFVKGDAYFVRMGVPTEAVQHSPQQYVLHGFFSSLFVVFAAAFASHVAAIVTAGRLDHLERKTKTPPNVAPPSFREQGLVMLVLGSWFYSVDQALSFGRKPAHVGGIALPVSVQEIVLVLTFALIAAAWALARTAYARSAQRKFGAVRGVALSIQTLAILVSFLLLTMGAVTEGRREASDKLWRLAPYEVITFHTQGSDLDNMTFLFVAQTSEGYWVHDLGDIGGKNNTARFVSISTLTSVEFEGRAS